MLTVAIYECKKEMEEENFFEFEEDSMDYCRFVISSLIFWVSLGNSTFSEHCTDERKAFEVGSILGDQLRAWFGPLLNFPASAVVVWEKEKDAILSTNKHKATFGEILSELVSYRAGVMKSDLREGKLLVQKGTSFGLLAPSARTLICQMTGKNNTDEAMAFENNLQVKWLKLKQAAADAAK